MRLHFAVTRIGAALEQAYIAMMCIADVGTDAKAVSQTILRKWAAGSNRTILHNRLAAIKSLNPAAGCNLIPNSHT